jgi:hypothetical protein
MLFCYILGEFFNRLGLESRHRNHILLYVTYLKACNTRHGCHVKNLSNNTMWICLGTIPHP